MKLLTVSVDNGNRPVVLDEVTYMTADMEDNYVVAQANEPLDEQGKFARKRVNARFREEILEVDRDRVRLHGRFA